MNPVVWEYLGKPFYQPVKRPESHWSNEAPLEILILSKIFCQFLLNLYLDNTAQPEKLVDGNLERGFTHPAPWFTSHWATALFVYRILHAILPSISF